MNILKFSAKITPAKRWVIGYIVVAILASSIPARAAIASEDVQAEPAAQVQSVETAVQPAVTSQIAVPAKLAEKPKRVWNMINSADLERTNGNSSEPAVRTMVVPTTAYTSDPRETDGSPFTTADGTRVYDGLVAANFLKMGTRIRFPDQFGDKVFVVHDRMNARYSQRIDIWMTNKTDAFAWGVRRVRIEILPDQS